MLKHLTLENFKIWKRLEVKFGQVTGVFGPNSTGKSSLLQWLLLLKQTKEVPDRGLVLDFGSPEQYVNLGTYRDVVHHNDHTLPVRSVLKWTLPKTLKISNPNGKLTDVLFSAIKCRWTASSTNTASNSDPNLRTCLPVGVFH